MSIPLAYPLQTPTRTVADITLRRYTVAERRKALRPWADAVDQEIAMIAYLAGVCPEDIQEMDSADYAEVQAEFMAVSSQPGPDLDALPTDPVRLAFPVGGLAEIRLRRSKVGDQRAAQQEFEAPADIEAALISRLAGVPISELDKMDAGDFGAVLRRFQGFMSKRAQPGGLPAGAEPAGAVVPDAAQRD